MARLQEPVDDQPIGSFYPNGHIGTVPEATQPLYEVV
jgi:hypothetical protein